MAPSLMNPLPSTSITLIITLILILMRCVNSTPPPPYVLEYGRDDTSRNFITFGCADVNTGAYISNAIFFHEDDIFFDLNNPETFSPERVVRHVERGSGNRIVFVMNRFSEGGYSCGRRRDMKNVIRSSSVTLVALPPSPLPRPPITVFYAKVGSNAILHCPQQPGVLTQQYYGEWRNSSSDTIFADISKPSQPRDSYSESQRYSILGSNFSLAIEDVVLTDSGSWYQCELKVEDPGNVGLEYSYGPSTIVTLVVYEPPVIITHPVSTVVSMETENISFVCSAVGPVTPTITWRHSGKNITSSIKYTITASTFGTSTGSRGATSTVLISSLDARDTGLIECVATIPPNQDISDIQLLKDISSVPLSVLGTFDELIVFVTTTKDVIFSLTFPVTPLHPIQLRLLYHEVGGAGKSLNVTPNVEYVNSSEINYIAFSRSVPYDRFQVEVSLIHGSVVGPERNTLLVYDKTEPSEVSLILREAVVPSVLIPFILLSSSILITLMLVCLYYYHFKQNNRNKRKINRESRSFRIEAQKNENLAAERERKAKADIHYNEQRSNDISDTIKTLRQQLEEEKCSDIKMKLLDVLLVTLMLKPQSLEIESSSLRISKRNDHNVTRPVLEHQGDELTVPGKEGKGKTTVVGDVSSLSEPDEIDHGFPVSRSVSRSDSSFRLDDDEITDEMAEMFATVTKEMLIYGYSNPLLRKRIRPVVKSCDGDCDNDVPQKTMNYI